MKILLVFILVSIFSFSKTNIPTTEHRAMKIIETLKDVYNIKTSKENIYQSENSYEFDTDNSQIEKRISISLVHGNVEVYTNPYLKDFEKYFNVCNAVLVSLLNVKTQNIPVLENNLMQIFKEVSNTSKSATYTIKNTDITIKPDSTGILGCEFYKKLTL